MATTRVTRDIAARRDIAAPPEVDGRIGADLDRSDTVIAAIGSGDRLEDIAASAAATQS